MTSSKDDHNNWITVGEIIRLLKEPVGLYTRGIVQTWHTTLTSGPCQSFKQCQNSGTGGCSTKTKPCDLCSSCKGWYDELTNSHRNKDKRKIKWRQNCDTSKWPNDPWEVAKFFMSVLGDNKAKVKDAESSDLSSLLNVLEWMEDTVFAPDRRVDVDLVKELRSEVRNHWAHAPNQQLPEGDLNKGFEIAKNFAADLDKVFSCPEVKKCITDIQTLQANGITNVTETELKIFKLQLVELDAEFSQMKEDQSADSQAIKKLEEGLKLLQDQVNAQEAGQRSELKSCIPDKPPKFIGRETDVKQIITSLVDKRCGIVSIVGGPGFGKTTVAIDVSRHLKDNHDIVVIFSYLQDISSVSQMKLRLCRDIGLNPGEDPESVLMLWVKTIGKKVVLVLDNIEQLLESETKSQFTNLVLTLRKNSEQNLQILTTTRTQLLIPDEITHQISELDNKSSVELLRMFCPNKEVKNEILSILVKCCGCVPIALGIVGPLIQDPWPGPKELIQWLEKPLEVLEPVQKAIDCSFQMLSDKDRKSLLRLSVFSGSFEMKSAQEVIQRYGIKSHSFLKNLVTRNLLQRSGDQRFVIHSLIRQFLLAELDHDEFSEEKTVAQELMVRHFLELTHLLTIESCSKNKFSKARELLKTDVHNILEIFRICSHDQVAEPKYASILEILENSDLYKTSSRFFYNFSWDLFPRMVLKNFNETCIKLAKRRKQPDVEITFQYMVADQEGRISSWKSDEYHNRMKAVMEILKKNETQLKEDEFLYMFLYCFCARYSYSYSNHDENEPPCGFLKDDFTSSFGTKASKSPFEKTCKARILMDHGQLQKDHANRACQESKKKDEEKYEEHMKCAESSYKEALTIAENSLGDHELTCTVHKKLGDLYFGKREYQNALEYYSNAVKLRQELKLDCNEQFVFLLKNYGACLSSLGRFDESVEKLKEAHEIADKLTEKHTTCRARVCFELAKTYWKHDCQEAVTYAKAAIEMQRLLDPRNVAKLHVMMGDSCFWMNENEEALRHYSVALNLYKELKLDADKKKSFLINYVVCLDLLDRSDESAELLKEFLDIYSSPRAETYRFKKTDYQKASKYVELALEKEELLEPRNVVTLKEIMGDFCFHRFDYKNAQTYYFDAVTLHRKLQMEPNWKCVSLLMNYGLCFSFLSDFGESVKTLKEARDLAEELDEKPNHYKAKVYCELAKTYRHYKPDCQEAAIYAKNALEMEDFLDPPRKWELYEIMGDSHFYRHENKEAIMYYDNAIRLHNELKLDHSDKFVRLLKSYGTILSYLERFGEAVEKLREALDIAEKLDEMPNCNKAVVYYELARTYRKLQPDRKEAAKYAKKALEMENYLDPQKILTMKQIIGEACFHTRNNEDALVYYLDAITFCKENNLCSDKQFVSLLRKCGMCFAYLRRFGEAVTTFKEALDIAETLDETPNESKARVCNELARSCRSVNPDCMEAAKYAKEAIKMKHIFRPGSVDVLEDIINRANKNMSRDITLLPWR